jgi:hypothetical protein
VPFEVTTGAPGVGANSFFSAAKPRALAFVVTEDLHHCHCAFLDDRVPEKPNAAAVQLVFKVEHKEALMREVVRSKAHGPLFAYRPCVMLPRGNPQLPKAPELTPDEAIEERKNFEAAKAFHDSDIYKNARNAT